MFCLAYFRIIVASAIVLYQINCVFRRTIYPPCSIIVGLMLLQLRGGEAGGVGGEQSALFPYLRTQKVYFIKKKKWLISLLCSHHSDIGKINMLFICSLITFSHHPDIYTEVNMLFISLCWMLVLVLKSGLIYENHQRTREVAEEVLSSLTNNIYQERILSCIYIYI